MRSGGSWYNLPVPSSPEGSLQPDYDAYISALLSSTIIHWLYKLTLSDQAQANMQLAVSLSDFLACVPLLEALKNFSPWPEPILGGPGNGIQKRSKTGKKNRIFVPIWWESGSGKWVYLFRHKIWKPQENGGDKWEVRKQKAHRNKEQ